jgi:hypothetical protein
MRATLAAGVVAAVIAASAPAAAQQVDQCALTPMPGAPAAAALLKSQCRLQIEDNARMSAEENLIVAQADQRIAEAKADRAQAKADEIQTKLDDLTKRVEAACKWRGVQNEPMAKLCHAGY